MTSYLIDFLLVVALVVTALRCGRMHKELRALRETDLVGAFASAETSLNRAAEAIVAARHDGVDTARALERQLAEARQVVDQLTALVERADFHVGGAIQTSRPAASPPAAPDVDPCREFFAEAHDRLHASLAR